jgi:hypothetical protein
VAAIRGKAAALQFALSRWAEWLTAYRGLPEIHKAPEGLAGLGHVARAHQAAICAESALALVGLGPGAAGNGAAACLRDWLLRLRHGDAAGWGDASAAGGWPRGPAAERTDALDDELRRLGLIVEDLGREVVFAPADGEGTSAAEVITAVRLYGEPAPPGPPDPECRNGLTLASGGYTYRGRRYDLSGRPLAMLRALLASRTQCRTADELCKDMGIDDGYVNFPKQVVMDAARRLRKSLSRAAKDAGEACEAPLPSTGRGADLAYELAMP